MNRHIQQLMIDATLIINDPSIDEDVKQLTLVALDKETFFNDFLLMHTLVDPALIAYARSRLPLAKYTSAQELVGNQKFTTDKIYTVYSNNYVIDDNGMIANILFIPGWEKL